MREGIRTKLRAFFLAESIVPARDHGFNVQGYGLQSIAYPQLPAEADVPALYHLAVDGADDAVQSLDLFVRMPSGRSAGVQMTPGEPWHGEIVQMCRVAFKAQVYGLFDVALRVNGQEVASCPLHIRPLAPGLL